MIDDAPLNLRDTDALFLLPQRPMSATVLGNGAKVAGWDSGLAAVGVTPVAADEADLHVVTGSPAPTAPACLYLDGGPPRSVDTGYYVWRWFGIPLRGDPMMYVPGGSRAALHYAMEWLIAPPRGPKVMRNRMFGWLHDVGIAPPLGESRVTTVTTTGGAPWMVQLAGDLGVDPGESLLLRGSGGDALTRLAFLVFRPGAQRPTWAVKFGRTSAAAATFDQDEEGLAIAHQVPAAVEHAPRLLGRFDSNGLPGSVETAAVGESLARRLVRTGTTNDPVIDEIATWIRRVGRESRGASADLDRLRGWLRTDVLPEWPELSSDVVDGIEHVPSVLGHRDLGTWNVIVDDQTFTVVDWEGAHRPAFPLWDLLYFLTDALAIADGAVTVQERVDHARLLHLGLLPASTKLFESMHAAGDELGLDWPTVGRLATCCWLRHARSHRYRQEQLDGTPSTAQLSARVPPAGRLAPIWVSEAGLAPEWRAGE